MRPTRFPPRVRCFDAILQAFTKRSFLQCLDRASERAYGNQQLTFGFMNRDDGVFAIGAEERDRQPGDPLAVTLDGVGDHAKFGGGARGIGC